MGGDLSLIYCNCGCGASPTPGWLNYDNSYSVILCKMGRPGRWLARKLTNNDFFKKIEDHKIQYANCARSIPMKENSVDVVYASHVLNALPERQMTGFLGEAKRVLRVGGILRLSVPCFDRYVESYSHGKLDRDEPLASLRVCRGSVYPDTLMGRLKVLCVGYRGVKRVFNKAMLSDVLRRGGFEKICLLAPGETTIADPKGLDLNERAEQSIYVECVNER